VSSLSLCKASNTNKSQAADCIQSISILYPIVAIAPVFFRKELILRLSIFKVEQDPK
jgi:hypothetical protein